MKHTHRLLPSAFLAGALLAMPYVAWADVPLSATAVSDVAERVTPAVVNITTRRNTPQRGANPFFGPGRGMPQMGAGSGVVISAEGEIVTNNHVIEGADEIIVTFSDRREFKAKLIGADKPSDLAFIKIEAKGLPFLSFGNSSTLRLGEFVLAVGNPFGVGQTVTMGIVSAKGRANMGIVDYEDFIQTDASINPGNSGGALVNLNGDLVGINTAIVSRSGGSSGIGFAVPVNMVQPIREQLKNGGKVRRGWLGVAIQDLTPGLAKSLSLQNLRGVLVSDVMDGGPADKGKLEAGDVITAVNGRPTHTAAQLRNRVGLTRPGTSAKLDVMRGGKARTLDIVLEEKDAEGAVAQAPQRGKSLSDGLSVQDLNRQLRRQLRVPSRVQGVVVTDVADGSPAERSGLEEGDVIVEAQRRAIRKSRDLKAVLGRSKGEVLLRVFKRGVFTFVVLRR